jgi:hypothetical protein
MALSAEFLAEDAAAAETVILWPLVGPVAGVVDEDKQPLRRDFQLFIGPLHCITFGPPIGRSFPIPVRKSVGFRSRARSFV